MKKLCFFIANLLMTLTISWSQNGTRLTGFDAVTTGRGGTSTGFFDNPSLMMNNPAGLSFLPSSQADLGFSLMAPRVHFKNEINDTYGDKNFFPLGCVNYAHQSLSRLSYGFGVFTQGGMGADFNLNHALFMDGEGAYIGQPYHSKFAVMQGGASIAYKLNDKLSIGGTANLIYGQVAFQMPMSMPPSILKGVIDPQSGMKFGDLFQADPSSGGLGYTELIASANLQGLKGFAFGGKIGMAFKPNDRLSFGINYTMPVNIIYKNGTAAMDMSGQMNNAIGRIVSMILQQYPGTTAGEAHQMAMDQFTQMGIDLSKGVSDSYKAEARFGLPQSLSVGTSWSPYKKIRVGMDGEWINWKMAFDQMDISLSNGTNANINKMMDTNGNIEMAFPMYWKNTIVIRTGIEYDASGAITLRGGYVYGSNPVPPATLFPVFPAIVKHHVTAGISVKLANALKVNGAYEYALRNNATASEKSLLAEEYDNSVSSLENHIFHISFSW
ncbi:MAG TPA: outer membrane protein transport protein, partial [Flavisolibacter sp.]|nr:outer membrane protein transport protein [Flavisolibacter sp.]